MQQPLAGLKMLGDSIRDRLIQNPADYLLLNDFYEELSRRNRNIENQGQGTADQDTLDSNKDCLALAEKILKEIDWSKYKGRYFDDSPWPMISQSDKCY